MAVMTVRELNANISQALARAEAGEVLSITRNGRPFVEIRPAQPKRDAAWHAARARLEALMKEGFGPGGGAVTYEDRYGKDPL